MGSWFSRLFSDEEPSRSQRPQIYYDTDNTFQQIAYFSPRTSYNSYSYHERASTTQYRLQSSQKIASGIFPRTAETKLHKFVLEITIEWGDMKATSECELFKLFSGSYEYETILGLFKKTTQKQFRVDEIFRVQNPYLWGCFLLKKVEMTSRYGYVKEQYLFHGTKEENRDEICRNNYDWRKHGSAVGNIFGKGVSFTPISCYASHYSDKRNSRRMMFVSKVLIANETKGNRDMKIPPVIDYRGLRYDTATKDNRQVIVKFSDNEFYPSYVLYYTGQYEKRPNNQIRY